MLRWAMLECEEAFAGRICDYTGHRAAVGDTVLCSRVVRSRYDVLHGIPVITFRER
jgi:hypothetical protein